MFFPANYTPIFTRQFCKTGLLYEGSKPKLKIDHCFHLLKMDQIPSLSINFLPLLILSLFVCSFLTLLVLAALFSAKNILNCISYYFRVTSCATCAVTGYPCFLLNWCRIFSDSFVCFVDNIDDQISMF